MKNLIKKLILLILPMFILLCVGCSTNDTSDSESLYKPNENNYWENDYNTNNEDYNWELGETDVTITGIGKNEDLVTKEDVLDDIIDSTFDVYGKVYSNLKYSLELVGFTTVTASAFDSQEVISDVFLKSTLFNNTVTTGIMYYTDENFYDYENMYSAGFFEIIEEGQNSNTFTVDSEIVMLNLEEQDGINYIHSYIYEDIGFDHFISDDKYITYYFESDTVIKYSINDNEKEHYNYMYGSLFNYDTNRYVYDENLYNYQPQSGTSAMTPSDYEGLQSEMKELVEQQNKAGYSVEEINVVYISPEAIMQYIQSDEEETFFGYSVDDLTEEFGLGSALEYKDGVLYQAEILDPNAGDYNWKSFLSKVAIGTGIILVGAVLTPLTGGASFGCALLTIANTSLSIAVSGAISTFVMNTVVGMLSGDSIIDALNQGLHGGLDAFANGFMIGAVIGSVGVVSGIIKPTACFIAGTAITTVNGLKAIEQINVGDLVYSMNEDTKEVNVNMVSEVFVSNTKELTYININNQNIVSTPSHPYYSVNHNAWMKAEYLQKGDLVLDSNNNIQEIKNCYTKSLDEEIFVYNFTVENDHTYFVGIEQILVHNSCDPLSSNYYRSKAGKQAKANALDDIVSGKDYYGLDSKYIEFIQKNNRFPSFSAGDGLQVDFAHALDVSKIKTLFQNGKISITQAQKYMSDPTNGILVGRDIHFKILHGGNFSNATDIDAMVKIAPHLEKLLRAWAGIA